MFISFTKILRCKELCVVATNQNSILSFYYARNSTENYVGRGCLSHLSQAEATQCQQNGNDCKTCLGSNCNKKESFQTCRHCNSDTDYGCVYPSDATNNEIMKCKNYTDVCTTIAYHGGRTERGCHSEIFERTIDPGLEVHEDCTDTNCNDHVFPADRSVCYQCIGQTGEQIECNGHGIQLSQYQSICHQYDVNDHCYAYVDSMFNILIYF